MNMSLGKVRKGAWSLAIVAGLGCASSEPRPKNQIKGSPTKTSAAPLKASPDAELAEARALFERNIQAIQKRNREEYLGCYRQDGELVRVSAEGIRMGFEELSTNTPTTGSARWPEKLEASAIEVRWLAPGVVYGAYKYRVVVKGKATIGLSERVMIKRDGRWHIAVTTAFPAK